MDLQLLAVVMVTNGRHPHRAPRRGQQWAFRARAPDRPENPTGKERTSRSCCDEETGRFGNLPKPRAQRQAVLLAATFH